MHIFLSLSISIYPVFSSLLSFPISPIKTLVPENHRWGNIESNMTNGIALLPPSHHMYYLLYPSSQDPPIPPQSIRQHVIIKTHNNINITKTLPVEPLILLIYTLPPSYCINMSGHALMGRPAARMETMALVINLYVLV